MSAKDVMAAFLSALVSATEAYALDRLNTCIAAPGFQEACGDGLLDHCQVTDPKGNISRPLELAARRGFTSVVSELLQLGASPALQAKAFTGNTPLHMAVLHGDSTMTAQMIKSLNARGGDVDIPNNNGDTALMFAMHRSAQDPSTPSSPIVHLLSAGASITATNRSGLSALMIACTSPADILWKMILRFTSAAAVREALTRADVHGNAALHLAARAGCATVCESLIAHGASPFAVNKANESPLDVAKEADNAAAAAAVRAARRAAIEDAETAAAQLIQEAIAERDAARGAARDGGGGGGRSGDRQSGSTVPAPADVSPDARGSMLGKSDTVITVPVDPRSHDGSQSLTSYDSGMYDSPNGGGSTMHAGASGSLSVPVDPRALDAPGHPEYPHHISADKAPSGSTALTAQPVGDVLFDVASVANYGDGPGHSVAGARLSDVMSEDYSVDDTASDSEAGWREGEDVSEGEGGSGELEGTGPMEGRMRRLSVDGGGSVVKEGGVVKNGREGRAGGAGQPPQRRLSRGSSRGSAKRGSGRREGRVPGAGGGSWPRPATILRAAVPALRRPKGAPLRAPGAAAPPLPAQVKPGQGATLSGYWVRKPNVSGKEASAAVSQPVEDSAASLRPAGRGRGGWTKGEAIQFLMEGPIVRPRHRSPPLSARGRSRLHTETAPPHSIAQHLQQQVGKGAGDGARSARKLPDSGGPSPPGGAAAASHPPVPSQHADGNTLVSHYDTAEISTALASANLEATRSAAASPAPSAARTSTQTSRPASAADVALPLWKLSGQLSRVRANLSPRPHTARATTGSPRGDGGAASPPPPRSGAKSTATSPTNRGTAATGKQRQARGGGAAWLTRAIISSLGRVPLESHPLLSPHHSGGPHSGGAATPATSKRASPLSQGARAYAGAAEHSTGSTPASSQGSTGHGQSTAWQPAAPAEDGAPDAAASMCASPAHHSGDNGGVHNPVDRVSGSEGGAEHRRGAGGSKQIQHSAHSSVPLSASCSLSAADKGRHVFQRVGGMNDPGSDGGPTPAEGGLGEGLHQGARALSDLGRLGSHSDERLLSTSSSGARAREAAAATRGPREGWHSGTHEAPQAPLSAAAAQPAAPGAVPQATAAAVATPEFTKATDLGITVHQLLGAGLDDLSVAQLDAIEDWHYAQLQRLALAKLTAHRSMLRAQQTDLEALNAEIVGSPAAAAAPRGRASASAR